MLIEIDGTVVSEDLIKEAFVCDLSACKGACCVEGEAGAPLEPEEITKIERDFSKIAPYLNEAGKKVILETGVFVKGLDGDLETPLVAGRECAYTVFDEEGKAACGIEKAFKAGKINWQKPISCHLYPVRIQSYSKLTAVNYHQWKICSAACMLGNTLKVPVFKFVKKALIRKFGKRWYEKLEKVAEQIQK